MFVTNLCLQPLSASRSSDKVLIRTQQREGKEVSACSLIHITVSQALPLALLLVLSQA